MKANELMIGDWMQSTFMGNNVPCKVVGISTDITIEYQNCARKYEALKAVEPIPLTAEILESNGFTIHVSHCGIKWLWIEKQKFELAIDEENGNKITTALGLIDIEIKYVHELQHTLKLCKIDKNIEL